MVTREGQFMRMARLVNVFDLFPMGVRGGHARSVFNTFASEQAGGHCWIVQQCEFRVIDHDLVGRLLAPLVSAGSL